MVERRLSAAIYLIEVVVAVVLVLLTALALITLAVEVFNITLSGVRLDRADFTAVISTVLEVFILIELFRIAIAYMTHRNVIPTVMEAALVAVARKFVIFEPKGDMLASALGLSSLLVAVAVSWWLLKRSNACDYDPT